MAPKRRRSPDDALLLITVLIGCALLAVGLVAGLAASTVLGSEIATLPTVEIRQRPPNLTRASAAVFEFTAARPQATFECALDTLHFHACTSPLDLRDLPEGRRTFRVRARDVATGRGPSASYVWTIDLRGPALRVRTDTIAEATGPGGALVRYPPPTAQDEDGTERPVRCAPASGSVFALGTTAVTCAATDRAGNERTLQFRVTVTDTTPPVLARLPADTTVEAADAFGSAVSWTPPRATDLVSGDVPVSCTPVQTSRFALGTTLVACSASDAAGNSASSRFVVIVSDTRPPVLSVPGAIREAATSLEGVTVSFTVEARDAVALAAEPDCRPPSGTTFPLGTHTVTCVAIDAAGNVGRAAFPVTVFDATPPSVTPRLAGRLGVEGWYTTAVRLSWDVVDGESEVATSEGCEARTIGDTPEATVTCEARSAGGPGAGSASLKVDTTPPGRTTSVSEEGGYRLASSDATSGVAAIYYRLFPRDVEVSRPADLAGWTLYAEPFWGDCSSALYAFAVDRAGNRENPVLIALPAKCVIL